MSFSYLNNETGKVYTDNPFVDELVYYVKKLAPGCIVKMEEMATANETLESLKASDLYLSCYEGRASFILFDSFPREVIRMAKVPEQILDSCAKNKYNIPDEYRDKVVELMEEYYIENYVEKNNYYRRLLGQPPLGETDFVYLREDQVPENTEIDISIPIHEQPSSVIAILDNKGIMDDIIRDNPSKGYLYYIGKGLSVYTIRLAVNFQLLYQPTIESDVIAEKWKDKYEINRDYIVRTVYSDAFKLNSDYYDNFIAILIIISTMLDIIGEVQEHIAKRDVFDERCVRYIFASYGIPYYNEIPLKYQVSMMRNLNTLLKFKSTTKNMLDICSIFGFDNVRVFKYFLLRDRKVDANGDFVFNYKEEQQIIKGDPITEVHSTILVDTEQTVFTVPFPFENYMEKGNAFLVKINGSLLSEEDYELVGTQITISNRDILEGAKQIEFIFYYNKDGEIGSDIDSSPYVIKIESNTLPSKGIGEYELSIPENFTFEHGSIDVIVGSVWISPKRYTINENKIIFDESCSDVLTSDRNICFLYIYNYNTQGFLFSTAQQIFTHEKAEENLSNVPATSFIVEQPYNNYLSSGNKFYMTMNSVYITDNRFGTTNDAVIFLNSSDGVGVNNDCILNFYYSYFEVPELVTKEISVQATERQQKSFTIPFPVENYIESGYQLYVRLGATDLADYQYEIFKDTLTFSDPSISVAKGQSLKFKFIYPKNSLIDIYKTDFVKATSNKQRQFTIPFPFLKYLERKNLMYVQVNGVILDSSKYEIVDDQIYILTIKDSLDINDELTFVFCYRNMNKYNIEVKQVYSEALMDDQDYFAIEYPFYNYRDTGNGFFVSLGSTFIDSSRYTVDEGVLRFVDGTKVAKGRKLTFTFIYHTIFEDTDTYVNVDSSTTEINDSDDMSVKIPWPYDNFLEDEGNSMIITLGDHILEPIEYDIFEDRLYIADVRDKIKEYGNEVRFEFHYRKITINDIMVDDNTKNYELKFVKVPISETQGIDAYIKDQRNYVDYDNITLSDDDWDGEYSHEDIKNKILDEEFSYIRTKYISIDNIEDMSRLIFDMPYFYNMLFDDVKLEERLVIKLPYIRVNKNFKLNNVFVFLIVMMFEYYELEDEIMDDAGNILYLKGFDFRADIDELKSWMDNKMAYDSEESKIDDFIIYRTSLRSVEQFLNVFNTNTEYSKFVQLQMFDADNKRIYDIYKKIYDTLMVLKYNRKFFQIADGSGTYCETYTEFLKYRDTDLYNLIAEVRDIGDSSIRKNRILELMDGICKSLKTYIDTEEYSFIFSKFPGFNTDAIKHYVELMILFFKSYNVDLIGINTVYTFDDKYENWIRAIDCLYEFTTKYTEEEYIIVKDTILNKTDITYKELVSIKEKLYIWAYIMKQISMEDYFELSEKIYSMMVHLAWKDEIIPCFTDTFVSTKTSTEKTDAIEFFDTEKTISKLRYKEDLGIKERLYISHV